MLNDTQDHERNEGYGVLDCEVALTDREHVTGRSVTRHPLCGTLGIRQIRELRYGHEILPTLSYGQAPEVTRNIPPPVVDLGSFYCSFADTRPTPQCYGNRFRFFADG